MSPPAFTFDHYDEAALLERIGFVRRYASNGIASVEGGQGPLLVLMHGGSGSWNHWLFNLAALARNFRVVALDLPGFGASQPTDPEISNGDYYALVAAAIMELAGPEQSFHLSGFSFGSMVAAGVAGLLSARAASLSLVGPAGFTAPLDRTLRPYGRRTLRERLGREPDVGELREMHRNNLSEIMLSAPAAIDDPIVDLHIANVEAARFDSKRLSWSGEMLPLLARLRLPILVLYGVLDQTHNPTIASRVAEMLLARPDLEVISLRDCGHWAMYERPHLVERALAEFHLGG